MSKYSRRFLADLASLLRHGEAPLAQLISDLNDDQKRAELVQALHALRTMATQPKRRQQRSTAAQIQEEMLLQLSDDPERHELLAGLWRQLTETETFKDRSVLARLAESMDVRVVKKDSRAAIISKILTRAKELSLEDAQILAGRIRMLDTGSSESFRELARFITRGNQHPK